MKKGRVEMNKKKLAGEGIKDYIRDGMILGLGTGSTAYYAICAVGELLEEGMDLKAVATSTATARLAAEQNIPLLSIDDVDGLDLAVDGVDEIDPQFNAIKGGGGALYREKVLASMAKEVIWVMDDSKRVSALGAFPLPVEIVPFGHRQSLARMEDLGFSPALRMVNGKPFVTDNGNYIADLHMGAPLDIPRTVEKLDAMTGVLEHGLFLRMGSRILVGTDSGLERMECI